MGDPGSAPSSPFRDEFEADYVSVQCEQTSPETRRAGVLLVDALGTNRGDSFVFQNQWLRTVPKDASFANLQSLSLPHCSLVSLPVRKLPAGLTTLNVRNNCLPLAALQEIVSLTNLVRLDASANNFPGAIPRLPPALQNLDLSHCHCESASAISRCEALRVLNLSDNRLTEVPSLATHRFMHTLRISRNRLTRLRLPASIRHLEADDNRIEIVPDLPAGVQTVSLDGNPCACAFLGEQSIAELTDEALAVRRKARVALAKQELRCIDWELAGRAAAAAVPSLVCPICADGRPMKDPVVCSDGYSYERSALETWKRDGNGTSPMTGLPLQDDAPLPNYALREVILEAIAQKSKRAKRPE